jgi:hypothetical protein
MLFERCSPSFFKTSRTSASSVAYYPTFSPPSYPFTTLGIICQYQPNTRRQREGHAATPTHHPWSQEIHDCSNLARIEVAGSRAQSLNSKRPTEPSATWWTIYSECAPSTAPTRSSSSLRAILFTRLMKNSTNKSPPSCLQVSDNGER